jgi:mono/diheme cytochrome c family protein
MKTWLLTPALASVLMAANYPEAVVSILRENCLPCHTGAAAQGGLDLSTADLALQGGKTGAAFRPGSAEASLLVARVVGGSMPPGRKLAQEQIATLRSWIDAEKPQRAAVTEADVIPLFQMRCVTCHGKRVQEGGLDLRTQASRLKGGKSGPALVPGKPEESLMVKRIAAGEMPPPKKLFEAFVRPPASEEVETLRNWIAAGAPPAPVRPAVQEKFSAREREWWSLQPPRRPAPPVLPGAAGHNAIDAFLLARLRQKQIGFAPPASRMTLLRRAYVDLTGLLPTPRQVREFHADTRPDAYERLVDRLLASPAYAERWARIWLDSAGYADSEGIIHEDRLRPQAWRYRDAVIRAIERDEPYDRFLTAQLAGDELADHRAIANPTPADIDRLALTGFLRLAPDGTYSPANGSVAERMNVIADEIEVLGSTVMGLTIGCARCHNHKYDPLPQRDYYRLSAILQTSFDPYDWVKPTERNLDFALAAERDEAARHNAPLEAEIKRLETRLEALPKDDEKAKPEADRLRKAIADQKAKLKPKPAIRALYDMGGEPSPVFLLKRGEAQQLGERVEPNVPSIFHGGALRPYAPAAPFAGTSGRRLALARWLTQPEHPLTARVMVNRLWRHHFGRGIVETLSNFGRTGAPPTHPELLDWLATEFVRGGWSVKAMHRLMMTSAAYRQSADASAAALTADPENKLLSRMPPRRMDAEQLRDSILLATGRLSPERFGPPVPVERTPGGEVVEKASKDQWRRSIYLLQRRTMPVTLLEAFDLPPMSPNCSERPLSTVSTQALEMRNSPVVIEHARYLAGRLLDEFPAQPARQIEEAYLRTVSRTPDAAEAARATAALARLEREWRAHLSTQKVTAPHAATARWHALGDFVHALVSSAEFLYVD